MISVDSKLFVTPFQYDLKNQSISIMTVDIDFITKKNTSLEPYDTDKMANDLLQQFSNQAFTIGQQFAFQLQDQSKKMLLATVRSIEAGDLAAAIEGKVAQANKIQSGQLLPNSSIVFEKAEGSALNLIGKSKG